MSVLGWTRAWPVPPRWLTCSMGRGTSTGSRWTFQGLQATGPGETSRNHEIVVSRICDASSVLPGLLKEQPLRRQDKWSIGCSITGCKNLDDYWSKCLLREEQRLLLESSPDLELGDVASCNLTMLQGGTQVSLSLIGQLGFFPGQRGSRQHRAHFWRPTASYYWPGQVGTDASGNQHDDGNEWDDDDDDDTWTQGWLEKAGKGITVSWLQKMTDQSMTSVCYLRKELLYWYMLLELLLIFPKGERRWLLVFCSQFSFQEKWFEGTRLQKITDLRLFHFPGETSDIFRWDRRAGSQRVGHPYHRFPSKASF